MSLHPHVRGRDAARPLVSILINNYNYGQYLAVAIESALAQDYGNVEIVVVDDGSTDDSSHVLGRYADRVQVICQPNGGQPAAGQTGLEASSGEIVMFLDSDDFLYPQAVSRVVQAWQPGCAKVQFRLALVGGDGVPYGTDPPWSVPLPQGDLIDQLRETGSYETPVTSGNAFPRTLLEQLFPIPSEFDALDHFLNTVVPLYGPVLSIDEELGAYRQHAANRWAFSGGVSVDRLRERVRFDLIKHRQLVRSAAERGIYLDPDLVLRRSEHLLHRLASLRLDRTGHPQRGDHRLWLLRTGLAAIRHDSGTPAADRLVQAAVLLAVGVLPRRPAHAVVSWAVGGGQRPAWMRSVAKLLRRGRKPAAAAEREAT